MSHDKHDPKRVLDDFIRRDPTALYTFDSNSDSPQSELCRHSAKLGKECIILQMYSKQLFAAMQAHGFFCSLPLDPGKTYMECRPMPK